MNNATNPAPRDEALTSNRRIVHAGDRSNDGVSRDDAPHSAGDDDAALLRLTPDMRSDSDDRKAAADNGLPEPQALRALVREILAEELADGEAEAEIRAIIRDELMRGETGGEIGARISQDVLRLVRAEGTKAQGKA